MTCFLAETWFENSGYIQVKGARDPFSLVVELRQSGLDAAPIAHFRVVDRSVKLPVVPHHAPPERRPDTDDTPKYMAAVVQPPDVAN